MDRTNISTIISEILSPEIRDKKSVIFIPSPGNGGDALISYQAYQLLSSLKVHFQSVQFDSDLPSFKGKTVIIGGGGGLVPHYKVLPELLKLAAETASKVIVLPQSIRGLEDLLKSLPVNVHLFVRDQASLEHALMFGTRANVYASEDLALSINVKRLNSSPPSSLKYLLHQLLISKYHFRIAFKRNFSWLRLLIRTKLRHIITNDRTLYAIRSDIEATISPPTDRPNIDISSVLEYNDMSEMGAKITTYRMLNFISMHKKVVTNRLHVGISAHLLGIEARLLDNSYGKISAVYYQSLAKNPKVKMATNASLFEN